MFISPTTASPSVTSLDCRDFYTNIRSLADVLAKIKEHAAQQEKGTWIVAHGSPMQDSRMPEKRYPNRARSRQDDAAIIRSRSVLARI